MIFALALILVAERLGRNKAEFIVLDTSVRSRRCCARRTILGACSDLGGTEFRLTALSNVSEDPIGREASSSRKSALARC